MQQWIDKAANLIEALPYIREFSNKIVVIKYGGAAMKNTDHVNSVMRDISLLHFCGIKPVLVHGGGPEISEVSKLFNIKPQYNEGLRITDARTLEAVQMAMMGKVNPTLVSTLNRHGTKAVGISGQDGNLIVANKLTHLPDKPDTAVDLGFVGEVTHVNTALIHTLLDQNFLPVIAPMGKDNKGQLYNINADTGACAIAKALSAKKLVLLSDVNGIYKDPINPDTRITGLTIKDVQPLMDQGIISGGMIPKIKACISALNKGVEQVHILDGKIQHSLLLEIFTDEGIGTMITR
jgi:acetylglutamate kinase